VKLIVVFGEAPEMQDARLAKCERMTTEAGLISSGDDGPPRHMAPICTRPNAGRDLVIKADGI